MGSNSQLSQTIKIRRILPTYSNRDLTDFRRFIPDYLNTYLKQEKSGCTMVIKKLHIKGTIQDKMHNL